MNKLIVLSIFFALSAHADEQAPIRMASAHGTIYRQLIDRTEGSEDVIAEPLCQFTATIPVYDIRSGEDYSSDAMLASCASEVQSVPVIVSLKGKVTIEEWGGKDVKGVGIALLTGAKEGVKVRLPKPIYGFAGSRELTSRSLMLYLDPTGWNGSPETPVKEEVFAATIEVDDGN